MMTLEQPAASLRSSHSDLAQAAIMMEKIPSLARGERLWLFNTIRNADQETIAAIVEQKFGDIGNEFREVMLELEVEAEKCLADYYIRGQPRMLEDRVRKNWSVIRKEVETLLEGVTFRDVLIIGSGACPITALIAADATEGCIVCLDFDIEAVDLAEQVLRQRALFPRVKSVLGDARSANYQMLPSNIILAGHVKDKAEVVERVYEQQKNARVVIRCGQGLFSKIYTPIKPHLSQLHHAVAVGSDPRFSSLLLT